MDLQHQLCIVFGDSASLIQIRIADDSPASVKILSRRAQSGGLLDERERKLLRLALDKAVAPGELRNCAEALIKSWRQRGVTVEDFDQKSQTFDNRGRLRS